MEIGCIVSMSFFVGREPLFVIARRALQWMLLGLPSSVV